MAVGLVKGKDTPVQLQAEAVVGAVPAHGGGPATWAEARVVQGLLLVEHGPLALLLPRDELEATRIARENATTADFEPHEHSDHQDTPRPHG